MNEAMKSLGILRDAIDETCKDLDSEGKNHYGPPVIKTPDGWVGGSYVGLGRALRMGTEHHPRDVAVGW